MRKTIFIIMLIHIIIGTTCIVFSETIDVQINGFDDGEKTTKQRDYKEAVLFAKREAIERAGVQIKSITSVTDLVVNSDYIESKADAVLLPGYRIMDIGYQQDGTYLIILIGKVKTVSEGIDSKELRYAKSLISIGKEKKAKGIIDNIIKISKDDNTVAEAMYCQVIWGFSKDPIDTFERLKAYYPDSVHTKKLEAYFEKQRRQESDKLRKLELKIGKIIGKKGSFIAGNKEIVLDTKTGLMWAARDNGEDITWHDAKRYCDNYRGGGYTDWRMPTIDELMNLYDVNTDGYPQDCCETGDQLRINSLIHLTCCSPWTSLRGNDGAAYFRFTNGKQSWTYESIALYHRALPVRDNK
ncbi:MAG: DUF1566 domain-containing protein [Desulfobacterales bacterium]|nr:DUF1566 domain-containing protein [Desulfobacterales bacterium]